MAFENEVAETSEEHLDHNDERPKLKARTLDRAAQYRNFEPGELRTRLLAPEEIWRNMK